MRHRTSSKQSRINILIFIIQRAAKMTHRVDPRHRRHRRRRRRLTRKSHVQLRHSSRLLMMRTRKSNSKRQLNHHHRQVICFCSYSLKETKNKNSYKFEKCKKWNSISRFNLELFKKLAKKIKIMIKKKEGYLRIKLCFDYFKI